MRKILYLGLFLSITSSQAWAGNFHFGVTSGMTLSLQTTVGPVAGVTQVLLPGYTGGVFFGLDLSKQFTLQPEINYIMKGNQFNVSSFQSVDTRTFRYLEIPLLLRGRLALDKRWECFLGLGPSVALLLSEETRIKDSAPPSDTTVNDTAYFPAIDAGLVFDAGLAFDNLILDLRFGLSLVPAADKTIPNPQATRNQVLSAQMGYGFF